LASLGHPCKVQRLSRLGSVTARHSSSGRQLKLCGVEQRAQPIFGRATITLEEARHRSCPERLLRCPATFSSSLMLSVAVSKLRCTELFFVESRVKVDGRYYGEVLLKKQMLPVMRRIAGE